MNAVSLTGRLVEKPQLKYTKTNIAVCDFRIAVNRPFAKEGQQKADFITCRVWKNQAENLCKYQDKGNLIDIEGRLTVDKSTDNQGNNRYYTYVLVERIEFLQSKKSETNNQVNELGNPVGTRSVDEDPYSSFEEQISIDDNFLD